MGFSYDDYLKAQESANKPTATPSGGSFSYDDYLDNEKKQKALILNIITDIKIKLKIKVDVDI